MVEGTRTTVYLFSDASIRSGFQRKVFSLVLLQYLVSFAGIAVSCYIPSIQKIIEENWEISNIVARICVGADLVAILLLSWVGRNMWTCVSYTILGIITILTTVGVGIVTPQINEKLVVCYTLGMVASVTLLIMAFLLITREELKWWKFYLLGIVAIGISGAIMYFFLPTPASSTTVDTTGEDALYILIAGGVTFIFSVMWFCLLQGMMERKGCLATSPEDFIRASMFLYLGGVLLFLMVLGCVLLILSSLSNGGSGGGRLLRGCNHCCIFLPWIHGGRRTRDEEEEPLEEGDINGVV